jgi:glyoxylate reductase
MYKNLNMPKVVVTYKIPEAGMALFAKQTGWTIECHAGKNPLTHAQLLKKVRGADGIVSLLNDKMDESTFAAAGPQLRVVANLAVGYDNIDVLAAKKKNIIVTNTPAVLTEAVAEHTIALMLATARRVVESDQFFRAGKYEGWRPELLLGTELQGKTLGVVGLGRIGERVAEIVAKGFGMKIVYTDPKPHPEFDVALGAHRVSTEKLFATADVVSIHVPLLPTTHHLVDATRLRSMKRTALLVNTSRGPVVDERALAAALKAKTIAGAGVDVFEFEPTPVAALLKLSNVVMTPHTASATVEARNAMSELAVKNVIAVLTGKKPLTEVRIR